MLKRPVKTAKETPTIVCVWCCVSSRAQLFLLRASSQVKLGRLVSESSGTHRYVTRGSFDDGNSVVITKTNVVYM